MPVTRGTQRKNERKKQNVVQERMRRICSARAAFGDQRRADLPSRFYGGVRKPCGKLPRRERGGTKRKQGDRQEVAGEIIFRTRDGSNYKKVNYAL